MLLNTLTLTINGLTVVLVLGFLIIVLWYDRAKTLNQFFSIFLGMTTIWCVGSLMVQIANIIAPNAQFAFFALKIMEIGFAGAAVAGYGFAAILVSVLPRWAKSLILVSLLFLLSYQIFTIPLDVPDSNLVSGSYNVTEFVSLFYVLFTAGSIYILWRYRARIPSTGITLGALLYVLGQTIAILNTNSPMLSVAIIMSSIGVLILGFSVLRQEIILPLQERTSQVKAMHTTSLSITSQLSVNTVLDQIAKQAAERLNADAVGVFLNEDQQIRLVSALGLPSQFIGIVMPSEAGVVWEVIRTKKSVLLENYATNWRKTPDLPLALETFGSVVGVPLVYGERAIGAVLVIAGRHGRAFTPDDVSFLEMLSSQAAVAISHSQLFAQQKQLTQQIENARNQLAIVLSSTQSPVVAVDRSLFLIFANAAAERMFPALRYTKQPVTEILPPHTLPANYRAILNTLRERNAYIYEVVLNDRIYFSHLAPLGKTHRINGWVAILNDVTELQELSRLKGEMVRMTSHDLKNPLQAAMANLDLLTDALESTEDGDIKYSLDRLEKHLNRMFRIISGVLDTESVREGMRMLQMCDPNEILLHATEDMQHLAVDKNIDVQIDLGRYVPKFRGDAGQMERALCNLIENAIKFTPNGGEVSVRTYSAENTIYYEISDTGIGIPAEFHNQIFKSFFRANQKGAEHISGTGLGLSLVKTVIDNHDGNIWLESEPNVGTRFFISLPATTRND